MLVAMIISAVLAQAPAEAGKAASDAAEKPDKAKKVCVVQQQLGSHFKKRICATAEEWEKRREADAAAMSKRGANAPVCSGPGC